MPASSAASLIGGLATSPPRPRGRSGCVTTASTEKPGCAIRARSDGSANAGGPQKTIRSGTFRLPLPGFFHLANLAFDQVALEHAEVIDEENSVQMVNFVAESAGQQAFAAHFEFLTGGVLCADGDVGWPRNIA